jgi:hypothetical protein
MARQRQKRKLRNLKLDLLLVLVALIAALLGSWKVKAILKGFAPKPNVTSVRTP